MRLVYALIAAAVFSPYVYALSACANSTALVVTGEAIDSVGAQFVETGAAMNRGLRDGKVTPEQYRVWLDFAKRFKVFYRPTVKAWKAAVKENDAALAGDLGAAVAAITAELGGFWKALLDAGVVKP